MHLPYESRGRRRREMADLEPYWLQSIVDEALAEHPDLGENHLGIYTHHIIEFMSNYLFILKRSSSLICFLVSAINIY